MTSRIAFHPTVAIGIALACLFAMPASAATIDLSPVSTLFNEFMQSFVGLLASVIVGAAAWAAKKWFGLQVDAKQRESLHGAIVRGIGAALETLLKKMDGKTSIEIDNETVALVANYVIKLSPGAVKYFNLTPDALADLIRAKFGERLMMELDLTAQPSASA
ncbi:hypothetical protein [Cohaesibacter haloalkalitolerans]|uniref:hypothetical protein n=1 Tax=Cohaesibacter haloalkalitolerans TaxID=1162980 RepID=UPI000E646101|nr:hypothetical protein [Cohaesibacter haloalkalitolerans]